MVDFWYSEPIGKVRATADPGGEAMDVDEAEERLAELEAAIEEAKSDE